MHVPSTLGTLDHKETKRKRGIYFALKKLEAYVSFYAFQPHQGDIGDMPLILMQINLL